MRKYKQAIGLLLFLCIVSSLFINAVQAQSIDEDPVLFIIGEGSTYMGAAGWTAGYVISGQSGTFTLQISATGPEKRFPVSDVKVVVCVSEEAAQKATVTIAPNTINELTITTYTHTNPASPPSYYPPGGVFSEPDYYGYNDDYIIPQLTYAETHHPTNYYSLQVTVTFAPDATQESKVLFLCYGIDSKGDPAKTPFSGGTLFVLPEYWAPLAICGFLSAFLAFGAYRKINRNTS